MTAPPMMRPRRKSGFRIESFSRFTVSPAVRSTMIEKIMVVAPTTAVPMSTGFAVALKVLPAPSFSSRKCFAVSKFGTKPKSFFTSSFTFGTFSMSDSS